MSPIGCLGQIIKSLFKPALFLAIGIIFLISACEGPGLNPNENQTPPGFDFTELDACIDAMVQAEDSNACSQGDRDTLPKDYMAYFIDHFDYPTPNYISTLSFMDTTNYSAVYLALSYDDIPVDQTTADNQTFVDIAKTMHSDLIALNSYEFQIRVTFRFDNDSMITYILMEDEVTLTITNRSTNNLYTVLQELESHIESIAQDTDLDRLVYNPTGSDLGISIDIHPAAQTYSYNLYIPGLDSTTDTTIETFISDLFGAISYTEVS